MPLNPLNTRGLNASRGGPVVCQRCHREGHTVVSLCGKELENLRLHAENMTRLVNDMRSGRLVTPKGAAERMSVDEHQVLELLERCRRVIHPDVCTSSMATEVTAELNVMVERLRGI